MNIVNTYLDLVAAYLACPTRANEDAIEAFEDLHPTVGDDAYRAAGRLSYEVVTGVVTRVDSL